LIVGDKNANVSIDGFHRGSDRLPMGIVNRTQV